MRTSHPYIASWVTRCRRNFHTSLNFNKPSIAVSERIDKVIAVSERIDKVIAVSERIDKVIAVSERIDKVIAVSERIDKVIAVSERIDKVIAVSERIDKVIALRLSLYTSYTEDGILIDLLCIELFFNVKGILIIRQP